MQQIQSKLVGNWYSITLFQNDKFLLYLQDCIDEMFDKIWALLLLTLARNYLTELFKILINLPGIYIHLID